MHFGLGVLWLGCVILQGQAKLGNARGTHATLWTDYPRQFHQKDWPVELVRKRHVGRRSRFRRCAYGEGHGRGVKGSLGCNSHAAPLLAEWGCPGSLNNPDISKRKKGRKKKRKKHEMRLSGILESNRRPVFPGCLLPAIRFLAGQGMGGALPSPQKAARREGVC